MNFENKEYLKETKEYLDEHKQYESKPKIVSVEELRELVIPFPDLEELLEEHILPDCIRYVHTIAEFEVFLKQYSDGEIDDEEFESRSTSRSRVHDAMISGTNALIRNLRKNGKELPWADELDNNRVKYAILAIWLTLELLEKDDIL